MKYVVANFKMNPATREEMEAWLESFRTRYQLLVTKRAKVVLCPPFVWLPLVADWTNQPNKSNRFYALGAQDIFWEEKGAFTGEISPLMLKDLGVEYVIVGHSERRALGETDEVVHKKLKAVLKAGLKPILAVGEKIRSTNAKGILERDVGPVLEAQVRAALAGIPKAKLGQLIIAYEPVWAVGTGVVDTPEDAVKAALAIRKVVAGLFGRAQRFKTLPVLYGGSVTPENVGPFLAEETLDGVLVGGASLDAGEFARIVEMAGRKSA